MRRGVLMHTGHRLIASVRVVAAPQCLLLLCSGGLSIPINKHAISAEKYA